MDIDLMSEFSTTGVPGLWDASSLWPTEYFDTGAEWSLYDPAAVAPTIDVDLTSGTAASTGATTFSWADVSDVIKNLGALSVTALQTVRAWNTASNPQIVAGTPAQTTSGAVVTPNRNGTITTRMPNGRVMTSPMPAGRPYAFADGTIVVNNGDGTYTTIRDGVPVVTPYSGSSQSKPGAGALVALGALALMMGAGS